MSSTPTLFSDKAPCFSQSERALYGNFIIIYNKEIEVGFSFTLAFHATQLAPVRYQCLTPLTPISCLREL